ncbi:hypothetical protein DOTSEDRAFT_69410 [Dothistroma septosporum NZE10]|uniref:DUF1772-domain-containing protein n=1 Tax=Dothistroma septosporum (strain NZE10 / CBS 128990) TaxID=675120 RepID=N1PWU2_DOTSN|nr:hypothetical protein DOTSEDRAFT_69410 [Dothistroma septosporum NZE10]
MAANGAFSGWWMTPLQAIVALSAGINCGGSGLQSPLTMPMLELPEVPAVYAGKQLTWLLAKSDGIFPRVNGFGTLSNLALSIICYMKADESRCASEKLPVLFTAFLCNVGATAWTFIFMIPRNNGMRKFAKAMDENPDDKQSEKEFRRLQGEWKKYAIGRATLMLFASAAGIYSVFVDGKFAQ